MKILLIRMRICISIPRTSKHLPRPPTTLAAPVALPEESASVVSNYFPMLRRTSVSEEPSLSITQYSARQNRQVRMYFTLHSSHVRPQPKQSRWTPTCGVLCQFEHFRGLVVKGEDVRSGEVSAVATLAWAAWLLDFAYTTSFNPRTHPQT